MASSGTVTSATSVCLEQVPIKCFTSHWQLCFGDPCDTADCCGYRLRAFLGLWLQRLRTRRHLYNLGTFCLSLPWNIPMLLKYPIVLSVRTECLDFCCSGGVMCSRISPCFFLPDFVTFREGVGPGLCDGWQGQAFPSAAGQRLATGAAAKAEDI